MSSAAAAAAIRGGEAAHEPGQAVPEAGGEWPRIALGAAGEEGRRERVHAVAEQRQHGGEERERDRGGD
jgi:hypothetical protein